LHHIHLDINKARFAHFVRYANQLFEKKLQQRLVPFDISFGHWSILRVLWHTDGITQKEISIQTGLKEPTIHTALKALEIKGIIERKKGQKNLKNWYVYLTTKGKELESKLLPLAIEANKNAMRGISAEDIEITRKVLYQVIENLEK
jgi:DNA-binding MarR family transcriptional regulator